VGGVVRVVGFFPVEKAGGSQDTDNCGVGRSY